MVMSRIPHRDVRHLLLCASSARLLGAKRELRAERQKELRLPRLYARLGDPFSFCLEKLVLRRSHRKEQNTLSIARGLSQTPNVCARFSAGFRFVLRSSYTKYSNKDRHLYFALSGNSLERGCFKRDSSRSRLLSPMVPVSWRDPAPHYTRTGVVQELAKYSQSR